MEEENKAIKMIEETNKKYHDLLNKYSELKTERDIIDTKYQNSLKDLKKVNFELKKLKYNIGDK